MTETDSTREKTEAVADNIADDAIVSMHQRLGKLDPRQVAIWRAMTHVQAWTSTGPGVGLRPYQFALDAVRTTEKQRHPDLSPEELAWRVTRRMQGDQKLGR